MLNKRFIALGLTTVLVAGAPITAAAAGPGGPGQGGSGGPGFGNGQAQMQSFSEDRGQAPSDGGQPSGDQGGEQQAPPDMGQAPEMTQPSGDQGMGQQAPPDMGQTPGMTQPSGDQGMGQQAPPDMGQAPDMSQPQQKQNSMQQATPPQAPDSAAASGQTQLTDAEVIKTTDNSASTTAENSGTGNTQLRPGDRSGQQPNQNGQQGQSQQGQQPGQNGQMGQPGSFGGQFGSEQGMPPTLPNGEMPELPEGVEEGERPELPEGFEEGERPELPEGVEEGERPELPEGMEEGELPVPPDDMNSDNSDDSGNKNIFQRIGGAIKDKIGGIGDWFKGLFGRDKTESDDSDSENTDGSEEMMTPPGMPGEMNGERPGNMPGGMGGGTAPESYDAANTVSESIEGDGTQTYTSTGDNENAILVDASTLSISGISVSKTGDSDGEDADFYGINAGILADNGSDLTLSDVTVTTDGAHANGVFSYGEGTTVTISDSSITTSGNNSGGLMTTGGGTLIANNVSIQTSGNSSAAIRTDRGGGTVVASGSTGTTSGVGSPAIYSTADITVSGSTLTADNSEAVVIEGGNSVTVTDSDLTGNNATLNGQSTTATNVLIYQSMSGDAAEGNSEFTMTGGSLTSLTGSMIHVTNVTTTINLTDVTLNYASDSDVLLDLSADSWGRSGSNGGNATVNLSNQTAAGMITVDDVSSLVLNIKDSSSYTGAINSSGAAGTVAVSLEEGSTWTLTGDTYIDSFDGDIDSVNLNGYTLYVNGVAYTG